MRRTCQSELQQTVAPSGPSLRPSNIQAQPTNAQVTGLILSEQSGHWATSFNRLKQQKPCAQSGYTSCTLLGVKRWIKPAGVAAAAEQSSRLSAAASTLQVQA